MDWHKLYFGRVSPDEVQEAVKDAEWQKLRKEMRGRALVEKYDMLRRYSERLTFDYLKGAYPCRNVWPCCKFAAQIM